MPKRVKSQSPTGRLEESHMNLQNIPVTQEEPAQVEKQAEEQVFYPDSTNIHHATYLERERILTIFFKYEKTGGIKSVYAFRDYPKDGPDGWDAFSKADSAGKFFNEHIKGNDSRGNPKFKGEKL